MKERGIKIIVVGKGGVGRTTLAHAVLHQIEAQVIKAEILQSDLKEIKRIELKDIKRDDTIYEKPNVNPNTRKSFNRRKKRR